MARSSLSNSPQKLNLSRRQADLFQRIILSGNNMAKTLNTYSQDLPGSVKGKNKLALRWGKLMVEFVQMLF